jgi:hypothetical protein
MRDITYIDSFYRAAPMNTPVCTQPATSQTATTATPSRFNRSIEKLLTGALLTLAIGITAAALPAQSTEVPAIAQSSTTPSSLETSNSPQRQPLSDGVYLYGQSAQADEIGSAYMVFEVNHQQVVGAFYMPSSSFDCFQGEVQGDRLALNVTNSYEQASYPYSVDMATDTAVASSENPAFESIQLVGYQPIASIDENNYKMLETCQARY